jgi:hypothetical protein
MRARVLAATILIAGLAAAPVLAQADPPAFVLHHDTIPNFASAPTIQSVRAGAWSDAATWTPARVPTGADIVRVGHVVSYDGVAGIADVVGIAAGARLVFRTDISTRLQVGILLVMPGGAIEIGTPQSPLPPSQTAEIVIRDRALDLTADPKQFGTGVLSIDGTVSIHGSARAPTFVRLAAAPRAGDSTLSLAQPVSGWQPGDAVSLPDSRQLPDTGADRHTYLRLETRVVQSVSPDGVTVTLAPALQYDHPGTTDEDGDGRPDYLPHVANLTRNIVIRSENRAGVRGHVLFTNRSRIDVRHTEFEGLGRTTFHDLDSTTNHIGRYPLHIHHLFGPYPTIDPQYQFRLIGNAIHDAGPAMPPQKWGITVHGSHYGLVQDNVVFNLGGAGIVTEDGSESFNVFDHNFVAKIGSNGGRDEHQDQPRGIAREGVGFWFRGPNNHVRNNVATNLGEDGGDVEASYGYKYNMVYLGTVRVPAFRGADTWADGQYASHNGNQMPLLEFDNNEVYGVVQGLTMWWLCSLSGGDEFRGQCGQSVIRNLVVWHAMRYAYYGYPGYNYVFDNAKVYGDSRSFGQFGNAIWWYGDYATVDHITRNSSFYNSIGVYPPYWRDGTIRFENNFLKTQYGVIFRTSAAPGACPTCDLPDPVTVLNNNRFVAPAGRPLRTVSMDWYTSGQDTGNADRLVACNHAGVAGQHGEIFWPQKAGAPCTTTRADISGGYVCATALAASVCGDAVDTTAPSVSITSPATGAVVSGTTALAAAALDAQSGMAGVRFRLDGAAIGGEDTSPPYSVALDSTALTDGPHVVTAVARDVAGNTATSAPVSFVASNTGQPLLPLSVTLNQPTLTRGDVLVATVHAAAGVVTTPADAYVVVQVPGGFLSLQLNGHLVPGLVPIARDVMVPTVSIPFSFPLTGAPPGNYVWLAGLTRPGTLDLVAPLASAPFTIVP